MAKKSSSESTRDSRANRDNRANQLNPNNDAYWQSRGLSERPPSGTSSNDPSGKPA